MPHLGVAFAGGGAAAAERHAMQHGDVVLDHGGRADHHAGRVIEKEAAADSRGGVNVRLKNLRGQRLQAQREVAAPAAP